ncbi:MAG: DNA methyltransferase [Cryomorphaceae bacterium]
MAGGINRFNRISSKEWLPFQKSWFRYTDDQALIRSNFRFFTTLEDSGYPILYIGPSEEIAQREARELGFPLITELENGAPIQFAFIDLRPVVENMPFKDWGKRKSELIKKLEKITSALVHRRFIVVALPNIITASGHFYPIAWDLAMEAGKFITLKDEKIACLEPEDSTVESNPLITTSGKHFYCLHFRKDENSGVYKTQPKNLFARNKYEVNQRWADEPLPSWFILKPQRRNKKEVLHPAKFPEDLADLFIGKFSKPGENVFDPMSGTGSTQLSALTNNRNGYGIELSSFFADIARERSLAYLFERAKDLPGAKLPLTDIIEGDARKAVEYGFPTQDLIVTSPPYWDMLNMKGAENQARRIKKGLRTNYSEDDEDLGNIGDYEAFVRQLCEVYFKVAALLKPGGVFVIVVKNIKKKGRNYPFAWDLAAILQKELTLLPEVFWCQDDISIAPYGYGNTFVSNTFHQYCLIFQKPEEKS